MSTLDAVGSPSSAPATVVPVAVAVRGPSRSAVLRVVEGSLGWPVVALDDEVLPPAAVVADVAGAAALPDRDVPPVVLLGGPDDDPVAAARAGRGAAAVLAGVPDAPTLRAAVTGTRRTARPYGCTTVAAAAGGVGATTVAAALAAVRTWTAGPTLLVARGPTHVPGAPRVRADDLGSPAVLRAAAEAPGVPGLQVVGVLGTVSDAALPVGAPAVVEVGAGRAADVLVVRPDRAGAAAVAAVAATTVVVVGHGPLTRAEVAPPLAGRRVVQVAWSARVAVAAAAGRCPADLPGTFLRPLAPLVQHGDRSGVRS